LFGDGDDEESSEVISGAGRAGKSEGRKRGKERRPVKRSSNVREDDGFDMSTLK